MAGEERSNVISIDDVLRKMDEFMIRRATNLLESMDAKTLESAVKQLEKMTQRVIAEEFGVHASTVQRIKSGALWS